jgi:proteasome lid subunit RPN8/RPN11
MIAKRREYHFVNFHNIDNNAAKFVFQSDMYNMNFKKAYSYKDEKKLIKILYK